MPTLTCGGGATKVALVVTPWPVWADATQPLDSTASTASIETFMMFLLILL